MIIKMATAEKIQQNRIPQTGSGRFIVGAWLVLIFGLCSVVSAEVAWPVGELDVQGTAIVSKESGGSVTVSNGTYTWFSGDRVENRSGQSLLILDNGTSFGFGESTKATVSINGTATVVEMHQGSVLYTSEDSQEVQFLSGGVFLSNRLDNAPTCVLGPVGSVGLIQLEDSGVSRVEVLEGVLYTPITSSENKTQWYDLTPQSVYAVNANAIRFIEDSEASSDNDAALVPLAVCALPDGTAGVGTAAASVGTSQAVSASAATASGSVFTSGQVVLGGFALAVTAGSTYVVVFRDEKEEVTEPPVSP